MTKQEVAHTMVILLSLDRVMIKDLMKLDESTLNKMYSGYLQNAKNYNHIEDKVREQEREIRQLKHALQSEPATR
tara:strand:- start:40847 stop:41071 length:225 start_codon:yes stop_codon:yes gene_type:complete